MIYKFNPREFGFAKARDFEEISHHWGEECFIKVIAISNFYPHPYYIYSVCSRENNANVWRIHICHYSGNLTSVRQKKEVYLGTIDSKEFAALLLENIFNGDRTKRSESKGLERLNSDLNHLRFGGFIKKEEE